MALFVPRGKEKVVISVDQFLQVRDTYAKPHESFDFSSMLYKEPTPKETAKLVPSKNAYHAANHNALSPEEAFSRRIRAALNKLTPSNSDIIIKEIINNPDTFSDANINIVVDLLFSKAISEAFFVRNYMNMISALSEEDQKRAGAGMFKVPSTSTMSNSGDPGASPTTESPVTSSQAGRVRRHLVTKAQHLFEELKNDNTEGMDMEEAMALRQRRNANIQFVAELLKNNLLSIKVISSILQECLPEATGDEPVKYNDQMVEIALELFRHTGKFLADQVKGDRHKEKCGQCLGYMDRVKKIAEEKKSPEGITMRVWFKCQDIVDLQKIGWEKKQSTPEAPPPPPPAPPTQPPPYTAPDTSPPPYQGATLSPAKDPRRPALPPEQVTEKVEEQLEGMLRGVAEGKEEWSAVEGCLSGITGNNTKAAVIVFAITKFASISTEEERRKMFTGLIPKYRHATPSAISRGIAWFIASALQNNYADDMPRLWDHCATFLVAVVPPVTMLTETAMLSIEYLDAIAEPEEKAQWGLTLLKVIDKYKEAMEAKEQAKKAEKSNKNDNKQDNNNKVARTSSTNSSNNGGNFVINPDDLPALPSLSPPPPPPPPTPLPSVIDVLNAFIHRTPTPLHLVVCLDYVTAVQEWVGLRSEDLKEWINTHRNNDKAKNIIEDIQFLVM